MATVTNIGPGAYALHIAEGSINTSHKPSEVISLPAIPQPNVTFNATLTINMTEDFCGRARAFCANKVELDTDIGSFSSSLTFVRGIIKSPIPAAEVMESPNFPELTEVDIADIPSNLASVARSFSTTVTGEFVNNGTYVAVFLADARGFEIEIIPLNIVQDLDYNFPYVISTPFIVDNVGESHHTPGSGSILSASVDDAKVFILEREEPAEYYPALSQESSANLDENIAATLLDVYIEVANLMFWRSGRITMDEIGSEPYVSHLFGVCLNGKSIQFIKTEGPNVTEDVFFRTSVAKRGSTEVTYIYGDIRYPADPVLSDLKPKFDIITDSEEWTKHGSISDKYVGSSMDTTESDNIFSWEGRSDISPKQTTKILAGLEDY